MQPLWDRGDADGYAAEMTSNPLPDTPAHQVLMQVAFGDHQVQHLRGRGRGAHDRARPPTGRRSTRHRQAAGRNLFYGLPAISSFPFRGSAMEVWDSGPGRVKPPPVGNIAPVDNRSTTSIRTLTRATRRRPPAEVGLPATGGQ